MRRIVKAAARLDGAEDGGRRWLEELEGEA